MHGENFQNPLQLKPPTHGVATQHKIAILSDFPVWLYTDSVPPYTGHYTVWLAALHEALVHQEEFEIHWVVLNRDAVKPLRFTSHGQYIHVLPRMRRLAGLCTLYWNDRRAVARELSLIKPDLVHAWGAEDCYGLCGKDFKGLKLFSVQGAMMEYMRRARFNAFLKAHAFYEPSVWEDFRHLTVESPWAAERVREVCTNTHPRLWEYAVEERFYLTSRKMSPAPTCVYAGTDWPIKNVKTLVEAFSRPELSHVTLKLAGVPQDAYTGHPANILPLGRIGRDEIAGLMAEAWCLVHMSLADTGPTIVKEARVAGVPVIISNECGSCQHVVEGKSGFILHPHDVNGLVRAVLTVTKDAQTARAMGEYGQEECRRALSAGTMLDGLLAIYRELLSDGEIA